jgi:hypothetical protein
LPSPGERQADCGSNIMSELHEDYSLPPRPSGHSSDQPLPVIDIHPVQGEGFYVRVDGRQWARFDEYEHAAQSAATIVTDEIQRRDGVEPERQDQQPYQIRDGNTGRVLSAHPTIEDANEVAFNIDNGLPYASVPANALAVEFWKRQPDGQYRQMTMEQVGRELEVAPSEPPREPLAPHERYRELLQEISDLRYPDADAALRRKIESSIDRKVADFLAERGELPTHTREQQSQQQQMQPPRPADRRVQAFEARMREGMEKKLAVAVEAYRKTLVEEARKADHQPPSPLPDRAPQRGKGIER